jgi:small subunit ribosomal protein S3
MIEKDFVTEGLKRTRIDEYLEKELERAGYGGMEIQITPLGTMVVVFAERPGMVIGRGGKNVRTITSTLKNNYGLDNPQIEVKEVDVPELNPKIMASKISNMLQRGMHFRRVAYSTIRRIMGAGAQGVEITISGKIRGSRSAVAKFVEGYIKKCGEPATRFVEEGFATVQLKPGVLGVFVRIMPPGTVLPDTVEILPPKIEIVEDNEVVVSEELSEEEEIIEDIEELENLEEEEVIEESEDIEKEEAVEESEDIEKEDLIEDIEEEVIEESENLEKEDLIEESEKKEDN